VVVRVKQLESRMHRVRTFTSFQLLPSDGTAAS